MYALPRQAEKWFFLGLIDPWYNLSFNEEVIEKWETN